MNITKKNKTKEFSVRNLKSYVAEKGGRTADGHISVRSHFRGSKRLLRNVDFRRYLLGEKSRVLRIESDPSRNAHLALLFFKKLGLFSYVVSPLQSKQGDHFGISDKFPIKNRKGFTGWSFPMGSIPISLPIYNIEIKPNCGGIAARAAGTFGYVSRRYPEGHKSYNFIGVCLPSGRTVFSFRGCYASFGRVSNRQDHIYQGLLASSSFYRGMRPHVRGVAMNPIDHPHGGGEGKTSGGRPSVSMWGRPTKGYVTTSRIKMLKEKKLNGGKSRRDNKKKKSQK